MVAMTIIMAAFLNMMDIQKKTEAFRKVNDNLNFAMEAMMRVMREGEKYCPTACADGTFSFTNKGGDAVKYEIDETGVEGYIKRTADGVSQRITSDGINIKSLSFSVRGNVAGDKQQPIVTISISGESGIKAKLKSKLNLQATVSQRKLDTEL